MSTITLPNIRVGSDLQVRVRLKDGGVAIDWSTLSNIKACIYSDAQRALAGRCAFSIDEEDNTLLVCRYAATKMQYLGVNRIVVSAKYMGMTKTYDKPAFTFVRWTEDQAGEEITIEDPEVTVEIDVEDVSSSILQEAVDAAFSAADRANEAAEAAEHMVDIHTGPEGKSAYEVAVEEGYTGTEEEWLASLKGPVGETPDISIGTVTTVEPGTPAAASMGGTPEAPVLNLSIPKGAVGATPNFTVGTVTTGQPGTPVVITITGTAEAPVLNVTIPQGMQGNTGSSVAYPYELVNNLTTNDATKGLSAAQGVVLDGKVSQLEAEVNELDGTLNGVGYLGSVYPLQPYAMQSASNLKVRADGYGGKTFTSYVIPLSSTDSISIARAGNKPRYCFLKSIPSNPADNTTLDGCEGVVGYSEVAAYTATPLTIPSDAVCVIITDTNNNNSYLPASIILNGTDLTQTAPGLVEKVGGLTNLHTTSKSSIVGAINEVKDGLDSGFSELNAKVDGYDEDIDEIKTELDGYNPLGDVYPLQPYAMNSTSSAKVTVDGYGDKSFSSYVIPLTSADSISLARKDAAKPRYCFLQSLPENIVQGSELSLCSGYSGYDEVSSYDATPLTIPDDAVCIIITNIYNSGPYLPASIVFNGTDLVKKVPGINDKIGDLDNLNTKDKNNLVNAINEVKDGYFNFGEFIKGDNIQVITKAISLPSAVATSVQEYKLTADKEIVISEEHPTITPYRLVALCRVDDSAESAEISARNIYVNGAEVSPQSDATMITLPYNGVVIEHHRLKLIELVIPPIISPNIAIHITLGAGLVFRTLSLEHYSARPNGNLNGVLMFAHLGYMLQRNNELGFQVAAKMGFNGCVANLRSTMDGVLVCAHDDGFIGKDGETYNLSEHTYNEVENTIGYKTGSGTRDSLNYYANVLEDYHLVTVDEFLLQCSITGMLPKFSLRQNIDWSAFKSLLVKYGYWGNNKCTLTYGTIYYGTVRDYAFPALGNGVRYCVEFSSVSETMTVALTHASILVGATVLIEPVSKSSWTDEEIQTLLSAGYVPSSAPDYTTSNQYREYIQKGVREFTVNEFCSIGLNY